MTLIRSSLRASAITLAAPLAFVLLTACGGDRSGVDEQLRADLAAAAQAPTMRQQFASPMELQYQQQAYAQQYGQYPPPQAYGYPQPVYAPAPAPRVVVQRAPVVYSGSSAGSGGSVVVAQQPTQRNTQKGAVIGAATGAVIGVATSKDRVKGGAIGAVAGAVLGGVIGHQIKTPRN